MDFGRIGVRYGIYSSPHCNHHLPFVSHSLLNQPVCLTRILHPPHQQAFQLLETSHIFHQPASGTQASLRELAGKYK
jgi:hypothetical protein